MEERRIRTRAVIEILGSPKEHVENTMQLVADKVKEGFSLLSCEIYDAEEINGLWSSFADVEVNFKDIDQLIMFCFDFLPSSVEIIEPMNFNVKCTEMSNLINDLLARLHKYDMVVKQLNMENTILKKKLNPQN